MKASAARLFLHTVPSHNIETTKTLDPGVQFQIWLFFVRILDKERKPHTFYILSIPSHTHELELIPLMVIELCYVQLILC